MSDSDFDPTLPEDQPKRTTDELSRSELEKETSAIARQDLQKTKMQKVETDRTVLAGPGEDIVPGYQLLSKLGEGGMGVVYKALQRSLNREVALKVMKNMGEDESFVARFRREAVTGARVNHPNIVAVYDHGKHQGSVYLVLEYVKGKNCAELLDEDGPFAIDTALRITRCAVLGLSHAHNEGVIHRDIKPANIMVVDSVSRDARGSGRLNAKVADFGLARLHDGSNDPDHQDLTQTGSVMGTPGYMAPEQALGKPLDFRADIYSLGSTLYCMMTGTKPFQGNTVIEVLHKKINDFALDPRDLVGDVSEGVIRVLDRMMAKNADDRYQSYENLLHDLDKVLAGEEPDTAPVEAHSRSLAPPAGKTIAVKHQPRQQSSDSSIFNPANPKSKKLMIMAGSAVIVVGAASFFLFGGSSQDTPETDNPVAALEQQIATWDELKPLEFVGMAGSHWDELKTKTAGLTDNEAAPLRERFRAIAQNDLKAVLPTELAALETLWLSRDWSQLFQRATSIEVAHGVAGVLAPSRIAELAGFASAALKDGVAAAESQQATALRQDAAASEAALKSFIDAFPFSPARAEFQERVAVLSARDDRVTDLKSRLTALTLKEPTDFFADPAGLVALKASVADLKVPSEREAIAKELRELEKSKAEALLTLRRESLDQAFKKRDFAIIKHEAAQLQAILETLKLEIPAWLKEHQDRALLATSGRVIQEKDAFAGIQGTKDPALRVALIEAYLKDFRDISPACPEMETWLGEALEKAPYFEVMVVPMTAKVTVNTKLVAGGEVRMPMPKGTVVVTADAEGYYPGEWSITHDGSLAPRKLELLPKPSRSLTVAATSYNVKQIIDHMASPRLPVSNPGLSYRVEEGGVVMRRNAGKSGFALAETDLAFETPPRIASPFKPGEFKGWQLRGSIERVSGNPELRLLEGDYGTVVIGLEKDNYYFGLRAGGNLDKRFVLNYQTGQTAVRFALEWEGDIVVLKVTPGSDSLTADPNVEGRPVGSISLTRSRGMKSKLILAVNTDTVANFREFELYPMN